jgi:hypothetical protein
MAVKGLERFRETFADDGDQFVMIGGAACDQWFTEQQLMFRATVDLDFVLILEEINPDFIRKLWSFIEDGGYAYRERGEKDSASLYRFTDPTDPSYPTQLELLSRRPGNIFPDADQIIVPIRIQDTPSLSAILLHPIYYDYLLENRINLNGLPIASVSTLILFKVRAWLNLTESKKTDPQVKSDDIKKHRGDVFRLAATLTGTHPDALPAEMADDLNTFLDHFHAEAPKWPDILQSIKRTLPQTSPQALITALKDYFQL